MNDRELLELAAKAAAIGLVFSSVDSDLSPRRTDTWELWNPLTDDGDALRLAVKLRLLGLSSLTSGEQWRIDYFAHGNNEAAATRRAIVRAAAEIGRSQ